VIFSKTNKFVKHFKQSKRERITMKEDKPIESLSYSESLTESPNSLLQEFIDESVAYYLTKLGDLPKKNLLRMVILEVEISLYRRALKFTSGNQTEAAALLGVSRGTFRKKLKMFGMGSRSQIKEMLSK
jgi:Fis family transcriptional regulator, factor for inversion stimulation protein